MESKPIRPWRLVARGLAADLISAFRNVARQGHRTLAALGAVAVGIVAYMLAAGFIEHSLWLLREDTIRSHLGHLQVAKRGYFEAGAADPQGYLFEPEMRLEALLWKIPDVEAVAPRIAFSGLVSRGDATLSFLGEGMDPAREGDLARSVLIVEGRPLDPADPNGVLLGQGLAASLGAKVGDTIVLLANTPAGGVSGVEARVRGLFLTVSKAYDDHALRAPLRLVQQLLHTQGIHKWVVLVKETSTVPETLVELRTGLSATPSFEVVPWWEFADFYHKTVTLFTRQVDFVRLVIAVIIVLSISNTMLMGVMERTWEVGTALALGASRIQVLRRFVMEGLFIGATAAVVGSVMGAALAYIISAVGIPMPPPPGMARGFIAEIAVNWTITWDAIGLAVLSAFFASLYPAWKAASLPIVEALRYSR